MTGENERRVELEIRLDKKMWCNKYFEVERVSIGPQFLHQPLLESRQWLLLLLDGRPDLRRRQVEVLAEGQAKDVQVLASIAEGGQHVRIDLPLLQILRINEYDTIWGQTTRTILIVIVISNCHCAGV